MGEKGASQRKPRSNRGKKTETLKEKEKETSRPSHLQRRKGGKDEVKEPSRAERSHHEQKKVH